MTRTQLAARIAARLELDEDVQMSDAVVAQVAGVMAPPRVRVLVLPTRQRPLEAIPA